MTDDRDEDDVTPARSPQAIRSTGSLGAMRPCPQCKGNEALSCFVCIDENGVPERYTNSHGKMASWELAKGLQDSSPPTERNDK